MPTVGRDGLPRSAGNRNDECLLMSENLMEIGKIYMGLAKIFGKDCKASSEGIKNKVK